MITIEDLKSLKLGSLIEMKGLMTGLDSHELLILKLITIIENKQYEFEARYMHINLGILRFDIVKGEVTKL